VDGRRDGELARAHGVATLNSVRRVAGPYSLGGQFDPSPGGEQRPALSHVSAGINGPRGGWCKRGANTRRPSPSRGVGRVLIRARLTSAGAAGRATDLVKPEFRRIFVSGGVV